MPTKYKVIYFDGRGVAEPIRFLLTYLGEHFEDHRLQRDDWPKLKPNTPFGKLPILEIDGKQYTQSMPLYRYLGKKGKLAGNNDLEDLNIDIIADVLADLKSAVSQATWEPNEEKKKAKKETLLNETFPFNFKILEQTAKNNSGYFANKKLSWVDFMFASVAENWALMFPEVDLFDDYPTLQNLKDKILNHPKLEDYLEKRQVTPF